MTDARRIMRRMLSESGDSSLETAIVKYLASLDAPPSDDEFHEWAERSGIDVHKAEAAVYALAKQYVDTGNLEG